MSVYSIPADYLRWLQRECDLYGELAMAVDTALLWADGEEEDETDWTAPAPVDDVDEGILKRTYRKMALKWHPDHGGSESAMKAVNDFYEVLLAQR